jgi:gliding motility-associated transport system permease protein
MSRAITEKADDKTLTTTAPPGGVGPSVQVEDQPTFARMAALVGSFCTVVGGVALYLGVFTSRTLPWPFTPSWSSLILHFGVLCLLFHSAYDRNVEFRRIYQFLGLAAILAGAALCFIPYSSAKGPGQVGDLMGAGAPFLGVGLLFLLFTLRHETDATARNWLQFALLAAGVVLAAIGLFYGNLSANFLTPVGLVLALVGLVYLVAFVAARGLADALAYGTGLAAGLVGVVVCFVALARSSPGIWIVEILVALLLIAEIGTRLGVNLGLIRPETRICGMALPTLRQVAWLAFLPLFLIALWLVYGSGWVVKPDQHAATDYFIPNGVLLIGVGLLYFIASYLTCSERPWVVMTRRELASFFLSPIAYIAFVGAALFAFASFALFLFINGEQGAVEPIVKNLVVYNIPAFLFTVCVVPALTMRLLSEEKRSGTLEVLLTSPVDDAAVVMSKFVASLLVFLAVWAPFALYILALHVATGKDFDYRPLLSFLVALVVTGASFMSMGLFFSAVTRNQIISFMLTLGGMLLLTLFLFLKFFADAYDKTGVWKAITHHMDYYDVWNNSMEGKLQPQFLLFPASLTVLWLFLTVKVLEARKWS